MSLQSIRKKILVDLYMLGNPYCGLGQVALNFGAAINDQFAEQFEWSFLVPPQAKIAQYDKSIRIIRTNLWRKYLPVINQGFDLWHSTYQHAKYLPRRGTPYIVTIHDLIFMNDEHEGKSKTKLDRLQKKVDMADAVVFISEFSKKEGLRYLSIPKEKEVRVIYNGLKKSDFIQEEKPEFLKKEKFIFSIGEFKWKKNFEKIIRMLTELPDLHLVIAGKHEKPYVDYLNEQVIENKVENRVFMPGIISEANKKYLYNHCEAFVFTSKHEGFGLPVIEAFSYGKPVFLSRFTSLPEIGKDHAFYFDDYDPYHMKEVFYSGLDTFKTNPSKKDIEITYAQSYSWSKNLQDYIQLYTDILS